MSLGRLQRSWERAARADPFWAILTIPNKRGRWDPDEFFAWGRDEVDGVMAYLAGLAVTPTGPALDFGCGVGRLTQALAGRVDPVHGVDIAPSMIRMAERYNRHAERCQYHLNDRDDLALFADGTFGFVYSNITLQHMEPRFASRYITEFLRVLRPGGILVFQLPTTPLAVWTEPAAEPPTPSRALPKRAARAVLPPAVTRRVRRSRYAYQHRAFARLDIHGIPRDEIVALVETHGGRVIDVQADTWQRRWESLRYCVVRGGL